MSWQVIHHTPCLFVRLKMLWKQDMEILHSVVNLSEHLITLYYNFRVISKQEMQKLMLLMMK